jgi:hypothetical protein
MASVSKTLYLLWRACPQNAWLRLHRPEIYLAQPLSEHDQAIIDVGTEVEVIARKFFPEGMLVGGEPAEAQLKTSDFLAQHVPVLFQAAFEKNELRAAVDVLRYDATTGEYAIYEIKSSTKPDPEHLYDLAFQLLLLRACGVKVVRAFLLHLNSDFRRNGAIQVERLFDTVDFTDGIRQRTAEIEMEIADARNYLLNQREPKGPCGCIYKGRSNHCTTFHYSNPHVPSYSVHDLVHIGSSAKKLKGLVDAGVFSLVDVPASFALSPAQKAQLDVYRTGERILDKRAIARELDELAFPLHFLDYETFAPAVPLFDGYGPYDPIPLQYSLHVIGSPGEEPVHQEFLHAEADDPTSAFIGSLEKHVAPFGSIVAWNKGYESSVNDQIALRIPRLREYVAEFNDRMYDLKDIFAKQYFVDPAFQGSTSIKNVLPVLAPQLGYKNLAIQDGTAAANTWGEVLSGALSERECAVLRAKLAEYCTLDSYGMVAIWNALGEMVDA